MLFLQEFSATLPFPFQKKLLLRDGELTPCQEDPTLSYQPDLLRTNDVVLNGIEGGIPRYGDQGT